MGITISLVMPTELGLHGEPQSTPPTDAQSGPGRDAMSAEAAGTTGDADRTLMDRIAQQDTAALTTLYDDHIDAIYSLAIRIAGEPSDAEAVVGEVFAQVWSDAKRQAGDDASVERWLLGLTRELAIARGRAGGRFGTPEADAPDGAATVHLPHPALGLNDDAGHSADAARLREALARLPLLSRLSIELAYFDGLTLAQVARQLELPEETVQKRIRSGLEALRAAIAENKP